MVNTQAFATTQEISVNVSVPTSSPPAVTATGGDLVVDSGISVSASGNSIAIYVNGVAETSIVNNGNITSSTTGGASIIWNSTVGLGQITNNYGSNITGKSTIQLNTPASIINSGYINGTDRALYINSATSAFDLTNYSGATISGNYSAIGNSHGATITNLYNAGTISGGIIGIENQTSSIGTLTNFGTIQGGNQGAIYSGTIGVLNNFGTISASGAIKITSTVGTLVNDQAGLVITNQPTNYYVVINSPSSYGQLTVNTLTGSSMSFGIYSGGVVGGSASVITANRYLNVLQGFSSLSGITGTAGTYSGYNYSLVADATTANNWDLLVTLAGPASADTQSSINYLTSQLQSTFALQSALLNNGLTYDCNVFDKNNICISTGAGYTAVNSGTPNVASGILIGAYKLNEQTRLGIWVNQKAYNTGTVGLDTTNKNPMYGIYAVWNQDKLGNGLELRASAGYESNKATTTRQVFGTSEAGVGSTSLTTQGASLTMSYNIPVATNLVASPYVGIRYSLIGLDGYTETSGATTPLTYSDMNQANTTLLAGVKLFGKVMPQVGLFGSIGLEQDLQNSAASVQASGSSQTLSSVSLSTNYQATRPIASLGTYYELDKAQRVGLNVYYASSAYQPVATTSAFITYTAGF